MMNKNILEFFQKQTCATICCVDEGGSPWCFHCFYVFDAVEGLVYFKSSAETQHSILISKNPKIAGSVLPDKLNKLQVKGIQFVGEVLDAGHPSTQHASANYYLKNPLALAIPGEIWTIQINSIKMTDNSLGFGKKISWNRNGDTI